MKVEDKVKLLSGKDVWNTASIEAEGIPSIMMADGPHGVRKQIDLEDNLGMKGIQEANLYPAATTVACSFNRNLAYKMGKMIGAEARNLDVQIVLGPGINIKRNPLCGRNFEYYSEDPYLAGILGYEYIEGLQSNNVGASLKHFAANSQETLRLWSDSVVDERALREIYLKNFEIALKANPATVMCCYNRVNGVYGSENKYLLTDVLRKEWGYRGLVVSDWGSVSNRVKGIIAGLDLEMPSSKGYYDQKIFQALQDGELEEQEIDACVNRVLKLVKNYKDNKVLGFNQEKAYQVAREIATEGIVLLKNDHILPLKAEEKVAIVGEFAAKPRTQGGGSSHINVIREESLLSEISAYTKNYRYFQGYNLEKTDYDDDLAYEVIDHIQEFDKVIFMTGLPDWAEHEGKDRENLALPENHLQLLKDILKLNDKVVVTLYIGSQVELPFIDEVKGILNCNLLGEASGKPVLDILYGVESPSGRLATTFPIKLEDDPSLPNFANTNNAVYYVESIFVGYRYYTTYNKPVLFPFGYGLSYSNFEYRDLEISSDEITPNGKIRVKCKVKNLGKMKAKEVVQLYIENSRDQLYKPLRELRQFKKIKLDVDEEKEVNFILTYQDFSYYDVNMKEFYVDKGSYKIQICKNAEEVLLEKLIEKKSDKKGYSWTGKKSYDLTDEDFKEVYGKELPPRNIIRKRPYTMDDNVAAVEKTFIGRILRRKLIKVIKGLKQDQQTTNKIIQEAMQVPFRTLATMSGGILSLKQVEGLVDILNHKFIKGVKKL
ncbi:MAG: glycoside hydrolase family 3 C-terminal domain-containing protein [Bacilli bacterium]|nr:glycoside hydrolase family 3 C-terminal domain-containing protein [Bacilli bacterium]